MRLVTEFDGPLECSASSAGDVSEDGGGGAVVVVGVKLDSRSKELLTWALVKVARTGDSVIAVNVLSPDVDKSSMLSLMKNFDSVLAAYEGFCNLKQVDLKLKVCRGSPVRKILTQEAKSCGATSVVVGTSEVHHTIRSRNYVAKYCAKNLQKNASVLCVDNGKILFKRESPASTNPEFGSLHASKSTLKKRTISKSRLSLPHQRGLSSSSSETKTMLLSSAPLKTREMPDIRSRWPLLHRVLQHGGRISDSYSTKTSSTVLGSLKSQNQQSIVLILSDKKQISESNEYDCSGSKERKGAVVQFPANGDPDAYTIKMFSEELKDFVEKYSTKCQLFSYQALSLATNSFAPDNLIGKGGSSLVYKGCQTQGRDIAVKILKSSDDVLGQFMSEIKLITSLHHKNIISLVGFCYDEDRLLLVYNFLSRGSLEENLYGSPKSGNVLGWQERYKIALGVAEALDCLHNVAEPIIHRDVKSSNILLSDDFEPTLSDFGLATWASRCSHHIDTSDIAGTFGYLAPEYFMHGKLNEKIDVYAFGVVLLELVSGRKPIDNVHLKGQGSLVMWAEHILNEGNVSELHDPYLGNAHDNEQFERMVLAATLCIRRSPQSRPVMSTVLKLIQGDPNIVEWARQETNTSKNINAVNGEQIASNIQSFINLALLNMEDDSTSIRSNEHSISVDDYLQGRWSGSRSFD